MVNELFHESEISDLSAWQDCLIAYTVFPWQSIFEHGFAIGGKTICNWSDLAPQGLLNDTVIPHCWWKKGTCQNQSDMLQWTWLEPFGRGAKKFWFRLALLRMEPPSAKKASFGKCPLIASTGNVLGFRQSCKVGHFVRRENLLLSLSPCVLNYRLIWRHRAQAQYGAFWQLIE